MNHYGVRRLDAALLAIGLPMAPRDRQASTATHVTYTPL